MDHINFSFLRPLTIRGKTWKNRLVVSPMIGFELENGALTPGAREQIRFYGGGGAAEYIVGETEVSPEAFRGPREMAFDFHRDDSLAGMREYASLVRDELGSLAMVELCHAGQSKAARPGETIVGPMSRVRPSDGAEIVGLDRAGIEKVARDFAYAAGRCREAGFDGAVIHGGHGWLFHQFLSPLTNRRTDEFGGSLENRLRPLVMTLDAVRAECGEDFILECRLSGRENSGRESLTEEEFVEAAELVSRHCDLLHISAGLYRDPARTGMMSTPFDDHGCNVPMAARVKRAVSVPVTVVGGINSPGLAEEIVRSGRADLVAMCRQWVADPEFLRKSESGRADEVRGCIRCTRCFPGPFESLVSELEQAQREGKPYLPFEQMHSCSVNPGYAHGGFDRFPPVKRKLRVLVAGGGCAGMECAVTAARRGHAVILAEQSGELGGILNFAGEDEVKGDLTALARSLEAELRRSGAEVRLNTPFSPELLEELRPDAVVAAVGSSPASPPIPGLSGSNVAEAEELYRAGRDCPKSAVVLGGGTVGCETAEHLAALGAEVTVVEMLPGLCADAYRLYGLRLRELLRERGCAVMTNTVCLGVDDKGVTVRTDRGPLHLDAELVVNALGRRSNPCGELEAACAGLEYRVVGDCVHPRNIASALEEGYLAALGLGTAEENDASD